MKLLIVEPNYLGDILMTTPVIRILRNHLSSRDEIIVITNNTGKELLELNPNINKLIVQPGKSFSNRLKLINTIKQIRPDTVLLFRTTFYNSLLAKLSGAKHTAGVNTEFSKLFLTSTLPFNINRNYRAECFQVAKSVLDIKEPPDKELSKINAYSAKDDELYIHKLLNEYKINNPDKLIIINPGTTRFAKQWNPEKYAELITKLADGGTKIIITGTEKDSSVINAVLNNVKVPVINFTGKTTIRQLAVLIKKSGLFISPDTGPMYLAAAAETMAITLFGSTDPSKYGYFNQSRHKIVYKKLKCSPCYQDFCPLVSKNTIAPCMNEISVKEISDLSNL